MTREERIADINNQLAESVPKGYTDLVSQNLITVESLVDNTMRIEKLMHEFKMAIMPDDYIDNLLGKHLQGSSMQLIHTMQAVLRCIPELSKFDDCMEDFIPAMGTLAAIFEQQKSLSELAEAIS